MDRELEISSKIWDEIINVDCKYAVKCESKNEGGIWSWQKIPAITLHSIIAVHFTVNITNSRMICDHNGPLKTLTNLSSPSCSVTIIFACSWNCPNSTRTSSSNVKARNVLQHSRTTAAFSKTFYLIFSRHMKILLVQTLQRKNITPRYIGRWCKQYR